MQIGNANWECGVRTPCAKQAGASATRPPGDTPRYPADAEAPVERRDRHGRHRQALAQGLQSPLSDHVRAAPQPVEPRPSREEAEAAVRTLIAYIGDDPAREGLLDTPKRVVGAYEELYRGYRECPAEVLDRTFSEIGNYDDLVLVRDIAFNSHCEHHMMPFTGKAHVAYMPVEQGGRAVQAGPAWSTSMRGGCRPRST